MEGKLKREETLGYKNRDRRRENEAWLICRMRERSDRDSNTNMERRGRAKLK